MAQEIAQSKPKVSPVKFGFYSSKTNAAYALGVRPREISTLTELPNHWFAISFVAPQRPPSLIYGPKLMCAHVDARYERSQRLKVVESDSGYRVSNPDKGTTSTVDEHMQCNCRDYQVQVEENACGTRVCKHIFAVEAFCKQRGILTGLSDDECAQAKADLEF